MMYWLNHRHFDKGSLWWTGHWRSETNSTLTSELQSMMILASCFCWTSWNGSQSVIPILVLVDRNIVRFILQSVPFDPNCCLQAAQVPRNKTFSHRWFSVYQPQYYIISSWFVNSITLVGGSNSEMPCLKGSGADLTERRHLGLQPPTALADVNLCRAPEA